MSHRFVRGDYNNIVPIHAYTFDKINRVFNADGKLKISNSSTRQRYRGFCLFTISKDTICIQYKHMFILFIYDNTINYIRGGKIHIKDPHVFFKLRCGEIDLLLSSTRKLVCSTMPHFYPRTVSARMVILLSAFYPFNDINIIPSINIISKTKNTDMYTNIDDS